MVRMVGIATGKLPDTQLIYIPFEYRYISHDLHITVPGTRYSTRVQGTCSPVPGSTSPSTGTWYQVHTCDTGS